jgi:hypothetical protein
MALVKPTVTEVVEAEAESSLLSLVEAAPAPTEVPASLVAAQIVELDGETRTAMLRVGASVARAALDGAVELAVMRTALARGERVIAQREAAGWLVVGALRTAATPGVDEGDDFVIKARRVAVQAAHEFSVVSGAASLVLRAYGQVETLAEDITSRAAGLHKLIGRMIRLN